MAAPAATAATAAAAAPTKRSPSDFLRALIGRPVSVRLNQAAGTQTRSEYRGVLVCLDGFMNIALEQAEEVVDGVVTQRYGDCFIRGNNVLYVAGQKKKPAAAA